MNTELFSTWLQKEMNNNGWSQAELARASGLSRAAISNYINQKTDKPDEDALRSIAKAFHMPAEMVFRVAGLLPPAKETDQIKERILHLADQLPEEEYQDLVRYIEMRLEIARERGKIPPYATPTDKPAPG